MVTWAASFWIRSLFKSAIDREGVTLQPKKKKKFQMKKENSYELIGSEREREREKIQESVYLFLFLPYSVCILCVQDKRRSTESKFACDRFSQDLCVCVHKTPRGGRARERPKFRLFDIIPFTR